MSERSQPALPATAWALLGLLSFGRDLSGYDLRRWAASSLAFFYWTPAPSQIYAELRRLETLGLVRAVGPAGGRRRKQLYRITAKGTATLRRWLERSEPGPPVVKHPTALRVWLGHLMDTARLRELVVRHRDEMAAQGEAAGKAAAVAGGHDGWEYPAAITAWSQRSFRAQQRLADELLADLDRIAGQRPPSTED